MEQLTKEQALEIYDSRVWEEWSIEYIARFQLYQERPCVPFDVFHKAVTEELGRDVWTHEFAHMDILREEYEGKIPKPTFEDIVEMIPAEKRVLFWP